MKQKITTQSATETADLGLELGRRLPQPAVIGLVGNLGAGKTELTRGIARGLGVSEEICSPTFVLEVQYDFVRNGKPGRLCHWDLYRLKGGGIPEDLFEAAQQQDAVVIVEWPEKLSGVEDLLDGKILLQAQAVQPQSNSVLSGNEGEPREIEFLFSRPDLVHAAEQSVEASTLKNRTV